MFCPTAKGPSLKPGTSQNQDQKKSQGPRLPVQTETWTVCRPGPGDQLRSGARDSMCYSACLLQESEVFKKLWATPRSKTSDTVAEANVQLLSITSPIKEPVKGPWPGLHFESFILTFLACMNYKNKHHFVMYFHCLKTPSTSIHRTTISWKCTGKKEVGLDEILVLGPWITLEEWKKNPPLALFLRRKGKNKKEILHTGFRFCLTL